MIGTVKLYKPYMNSRKRMVKAMAKIAKQLTELIGNTPLLELTNYEKENELEANLIVKLEYFNPLGSVKDRVAHAMIEQGIADGKINSDTVIIEPTSGNTGIGLAFVTAAKGLHLILTMPDTMSVERRKIVSALGAEIVLTPGRDGMKGAIKKAEELKEEYGNAFIPQQFENEANPAIHKKTTAQEILKDTDGKVDIFVSAVGTGGTVTGTGQGLKEANPDVVLVHGDTTTSTASAHRYYPEESRDHIKFRELEPDLYRMFWIKKFWMKLFRLKMMMLLKHQEK